MTGNNDLFDPFGSFVDLNDLGIPIKTFYIVISNIPVSTVKLEGLLSNLRRRKLQG